MKRISCLFIFILAISFSSCNNFLWPEKEINSDVKNQSSFASINTFEEKIILDKNKDEVNFKMVSIDFENISEDSIILGEDVCDVIPYRTSVAPFKIGKFEVTYNTWYFIYQWATSNDRGDKKYTFGNSGVEGQYGNAESQNPISTGEPKLIDMPVANVSWYDAIVWCNALNEYLNLECVYFSDSVYKEPIRSSYPPRKYPMEIEDLKLNEGDMDNPCVNEKSNGFRLLKNKEWEYAARKNRDGTFISGRNCSGDFSGSFYAPNNIEKLNGIDYEVSTKKNDYLWWYRTSSGECAETANKQDDTLSSIKAKTGNNNISGRRHYLVGGKLPNDLGIYYMCGNVMEWCFDMYVQYGSIYKISNTRCARNGEVFNDFSNHPIRSGYPQNNFPSAGCGLRLAQNN